ncbi:MAG: LLM class flavin-dependent oxidoreductase [Xanthobacteraceae bacterium]
MRLGLFFDGSGHHVAAWRHPSVNAQARLDIEQYVRIAQTAERGKFDLLFTADTNATFGADDVDVWQRTSACARLEPLTLLAALAMATKRIGLVATMTTTYYEPFTVARFFASLDHISKGRSGWNLVTSLAAAEALNFSRETHAEHAVRYARAREFAEVVLGLWESWDDGAVIADKASGMFFDPEKMHFLNHKGEHFSVRGPLMMQRCPQGHPVIVQAGQSEQGRELAAETAEVVFTVQQNLDAARAFYSDVKQRAARHGRDPSAIKVLPGVMVVIGETRAHAEEKYEQLQELIEPELGIKNLSAYFGKDLSGYPLDGPVPDPIWANAEHGRLKVIVELARREKLSIRQLYKRVIGQRAHRTVCGTARDIAGTLEHWFTAGAADGFNLLPLTIPDGLDDIVDLLVPELQRRGLFRTEYEGVTLRENLGLAKPESRWSRSRVARTPSTVAS